MCLDPSSGEVEQENPWPCCLASVAKPQVSGLVQTVLVFLLQQRATCVWKGLFYCTRLQPIIEGNWVRTWRGIEAETMEKDCLLALAQLAFLLSPFTAISNQSANVPGQSDVGNCLTWGSSSQVTPGCVRLMVKATQDNHPSPLSVFHSSLFYHLSSPIKLSSFYSHVRPTSLRKSPDKTNTYQETVKSVWS